MAGQETYGNWLGPPGAAGVRLVRQGGIYSVAGRTTPGGDFRPASPDSFEDDYDDVSVAEAEQGPKGTSEDLQPKDLYILAGKPAAPNSSPQKGEPQPAGARRRRVTSVAVLYLLVALSFVAWALLFALAVVKYLEIMEELKFLRLNLSEGQGRAGQEAVEARREQARMRTVMHKVYEELQDVEALICRSFMDYRKCSGGWKRFGKSCYTFSTEALSWEDARESCADLGAHLAIVDSELEQSFLMENLNGSSSSWLGLTDQEVEGLWLWLDGNRPTISYWKVWEEQEELEQKDCGSITPEGLWRAESCSQPLLWVCEKASNC